MYVILLCYEAYEYDNNVNWMYFDKICLIKHEIFNKTVLGF